MTKAEQRKMARLEKENEALRYLLNSQQGVCIPLVRELTAYKVAFARITEEIAAAKELAR